MRRGAGIYIVARVHGLRTHLIAPRDIHVLAKAKNLREISDNLMKTEYATEIARLPTQEQDATILEEVFLKKLVQRFFFLMRVAQGNMQNLLRRYCARFEVENIKRIIRAKHGQGAEKPRLLPVPREYSLVNFSALVKAKDIDEAVSLLRDTPYYPIYEKLQPYRESGTTILLEATLDKIYFSRVWEMVGKISGIRDLIGEEIDLRNLLIAFSLKSREISLRHMEEAIIPLSYRLPKTTLHTMLQSRLEDVPNILTKSYSRLAFEAVNMVKNDSTRPLEWLFFEQLYNDASAALRTKPLQAGYIIAYLLLCECEAKNLVSIVTGKELNLTEEEISKGLLAITS